MSNLALVSSNSKVNLTTEKEASVSIIACINSIDRSNIDLADMLYQVKDRKLYDKQTYIDGKGKRHLCKNLADYVKSLDINLKSTQAYNYANVGEVRSWIVYKQDENGSIIFGIPEVNEVTGLPELHTEKVVDLYGNYVKDKDENGQEYDIVGEEISYTPTEPKRVIVNGKVELTQDGDPIPSIYLTRIYRQVLDLYDFSVLGELFIKIGSARAILNLHYKGDINPNMSFRELKAAINRLVNPVDIPEDKTEDKTEKGKTEKGKTEKGKTEKGKTEKGKTEDKTEDKTEGLTLSKADCTILVAFIDNNPTGHTDELKVIYDKLKAIVG